MADTVNQFNHRLDKYWKKYDFVYDHRAILKNAVTVSSYPPPNLTPVTFFAGILYIVCYLKTFISYHMFYTLHVVEPLRYDSVLIKETN